MKSGRIRRKIRLTAATLAIAAIVAFTVQTMPDCISDAAAVKQTQSITETADAGIGQITGLSWGTSGRFISLKWNGVSGADGYFIERSCDGKTYERIAVRYSNTDCAYTDYRISPGHTYRYRVLPYKSEGNTVLFGLAEQTGNMLSRLQAPLITDIRKGTDGESIFLFWKEVPEAQKYDVFEKTSGGWKLLGTTDELVYRVGKEKNKDLTVCVRASARIGGREIYSSMSDGCMTVPTKDMTGMKILFEGDSIVYGQGYEQKSPMSFTHRVGTVLNCHVTVKAVPRSVAGYEVKRKCPGVYARMKEGKTKVRGYQVICIGVGTNDFTFSAVPGRPSDTAKDGTFSGYLNECIKMIRHQNPDAAIVFITPSYRTRLGEDYTKSGFYVQNRKGYTLKDYEDTLTETVGQYENVYVYNSRTAGVVTEENAQRYLYDGLHPSEEGYALIGNSLASFLEKNVLPVLNNR